MSNRKLKGVLMLFWSMLFVHLETKMFGDNWLPQSIEELACDFIGLAVGLIGIYFILSKPKP